MSTPAHDLLVSDLTVRRGDRTHVDGVSQALRPGGLTVLVGPNGAGKTTLVRAICGLVPATGTVSYNGAALASRSPAERARLVAYVPQGHIAHWPVTVETAVAIGRMPRVSSLARLSDRDREVVADALRAVDAAHLAHRDVTTLSGGERARVMLARALAVEAPVLLLDEPVAALDPAHQLGICRLMSELAEQGRIVLAVMHDLALASRHAREVLVMAQGRLVASGRPDDALRDELLADVFGITASRHDVDGRTAVFPVAITRDRA